MNEKSTEKDKSKSLYRVFQDPNPYSGLGRAVSYMMTKPNFSTQPFGLWSRILTGQINRKHYFFVLEDTKVVESYS